MARTLRLILGDQLNQNHRWFSSQCPECIYTLMEMRQETDYVVHHIQKVLGFFAAMRNFSELLLSRGHRVDYYKINDSNNTGDLEKNILQLIEKHRVERFEYQSPDEYRLAKQLKSIAQSLQKRGLQVQEVDTEHFFTQRDELKTFFEGKKTYLMESFYRHLRKKHNVLMEGNNPVGGKWNYDKQNRDSLPKEHLPVAPLLFENNLLDIEDEIKVAEISTMGSVDAKRYLWPIDRPQALDLLDYFADNALPWFGQFQDALTSHSWSVYHSRISFAMNLKLISPAEVINRVIAQWEKHRDKIDIAQVEGFVRQIIGWREYMRGVYWAHMPEFAELNYFNHEGKLPEWFWTGKTKMACVRHAVEQSLQYSYAHHIQRLMITGNFALLAGINPDEVDQWYLGIYIDAIEWVEITNTRGMSQFADGGIVGTKPYVSSANYIDKMGHYCSSCFYNKAQKTEEKACPFNSLYWHFYARNRDKLSNNPRIGMMYRTWDKMSADKQDALLKKGDSILSNLENL